MDTITHGLLGAVVAQLGFRQRIGRDATWAAVVATVAPDLDIFITPLLTLTGAETNGFSSFANHRGITHSLLMVPLMSLILAGLWAWFRKKVYPETRPVSFWLLGLCVLSAMLTHPLLDWCTSYGTQLFSPLTNHRYVVDAIPIVDIIYTPLLILTLLACFVVRKIKKDSSRASLIIGWVGFGLSVGYIATGYGLGRLTLSEAKKTMARRFPCTGDCKYKAYPQLGTIWVWRVTRQCPEGWAAARVNLLMGSSDVPLRMNYEKNVDNEWVRRAREFPEIRLFDWFTMGQMRMQYRQGNHQQVVEFQDMRYGIRPESLESIWSVRATFDEIAGLWNLEHIQHHRRETLSQAAGQAWRDIWNP
jgi:inner membrane protein